LIEFSSCSGPPDLKSEGKTKTRFHHEDTKSQRKAKERERFDRDIARACLPWCLGAFVVNPLHSILEKPGATLFLQFGKPIVDAARAFALARPAAEVSL